MVLPAVFGVLALGVLVCAALEPLTHLAVGLATAAMVAAGLRAALTYRQNLQMLRREFLDAVTDALTGLGNRRRLMGDLDLAVERGLESDHSTLAFFDLDGFKRYNDTFGHGAGDALLARLGAALALAVEGRGEAYRLGGDEFCVLLHGRFTTSDGLIAAAQAALTERGSGFTVTASCGVVIVPEDAGTVTSALALADKRMYADKGSGGRSSHAQIQSVLMRLLGEREPSLQSHLRDVGELTAAIGRLFDLNSEELDELRRAAELHDLGKLAIPEGILRKPGPLNEGELRFLRQHTIIGERILDVAPALRPVAKLVRSSHERWDGSGLSGLARRRASIPLGSTDHRGLRRLHRHAQRSSLRGRENAQRGSVGAPPPRREPIRPPGCRDDLRLSQRRGHRAGKGRQSSPKTGAPGTRPDRSADCDDPGALPG